MYDVSGAGGRARRSSTAAVRDSGMTLPELLISIIVLGMVIAVLTAGVSVTLKQNENSRGRVEVARWEQNLGMWLPDDLTSALADSLSTSPSDTPCGAGAATCDGIAMAGSNALAMNWIDDGVTTTVSYRYQPDGPTAYGLFRVACTAGSCSSVRVLSDLAAPVADPDPWVPGTSPVPSGIISVQAPAPGSGPDEDGRLPVRSVTVAVNGVPLPDGTDRSSSVTLAAGGAPTGTLAPPNFTPPSFGEARTDCGGPITLIVDTSGSIGGAMGDIREGVKAFVNLFEGTPTRLQIIPFSNVSTVIMPPELAARTSPPPPANYYYDMLDPGTTGDDGIADEINAEVDKLRTILYTNWEDAIYRTFYTSAGVTHKLAGNPSVPQPKLVVFFTDGLPTVDRASGTGFKSDTVPANRETGNTSSFPQPYRERNTVTPGSTHTFSPRAYYRANFYADPFITAGVRIIGLGVGPEFGQSRTVHLDDDGNVGPLAAGWTSTPTTHEQILGNLVGSGQPYLPGSDYRGTKYSVRQWNAADKWGDVSNANLLVSNDITKFADALKAIALDNCGGTLTVQTRYQSDSTTAAFDLEYEVEGVAVTTTRAAKSGTFDVDLAGEVSRPVRLSPQASDLAVAEGIGYRGADWSCRAAGKDLVEGTDFTLVDPADPGVGIDVTVRANAAVSCTLLVAPA